MNAPKTQAKNARKSFAARRPFSSFSDVRKSGTRFAVVAQRIVLTPMHWVS
jgi:hypothetical protein